ncbi:MAG: hydrolase [Clostridia bacterium]
MENNNKQKFLEICQLIKREGIDKLIAYLEKSDFYTAPASSKFHSNFEGGLCEHSLKVYARFKQNVANEFPTGEISEETIAIVALFHDICKINYYKPDTRNIKIDGVWVQRPYYSVEDTLPYGHGEKSAYILSGFLRLSRDEAMAINWHMGAFDDRIKGGNFQLSNVFNNYKLAFVFHVSDIEATYLDEKIIN